jgi:hypothetical protein
MMVHDVRCPRCGIRRTTHFGSWGRFCFNCRVGFDSGESYRFRPAELVRLQHYRAAIRQGLYSDWLQHARPGSTELLSSDPV